MGNVAQNWRDFAEQLQWFLEGTESTEKGDKAKIGILLSYTGKEAREIYKTLPWTTDGDENKFKKCWKPFRSIAHLARTLSTRDTYFGAFNKKRGNQSILILHS